jgi:DNA-binding transcriptional LysR family regulator
MGQPELKMNDTVMQITVSLMWDRMAEIQCFLAAAPVCHGTLPAVWCFTRHHSGHFFDRPPANVAAHTDAQNRRIIDRAFTAVNVHPSPKLETNSIMNLLASVKTMGLASIMPEYFINVLGRLEGVKAVPLIEPRVEHAVGLVGLPREPLSPLVSALFAAARKIKS